MLEDYDTIVERGHTQEKKHGSVISYHHDPAVKKEYAHPRKCSKVTPELPPFSSPDGCNEEDVGYIYSEDRGGGRAFASMWREKIHRKGKVKKKKKNISKLGVAIVK